MELNPEMLKDMMAGQLANWFITRHVSRTETPDPKELAKDIEEFCEQWQAGFLQGMQDIVTMLKERKEDAKAFKESLPSRFAGLRQAADGHLEPWRLGYFSSIRMVTFQFSEKNDETPPAAQPSPLEQN